MEKSHFHWTNFRGAGHRRQQKIHLAETAVAVALHTKDVSPNMVARFAGNVNELLVAWDARFQFEIVGIRHGCFAVIREIAGRKSIFIREWKCYNVI
jgi:hypothetical protein